MDKVRTKLSKGPEKLQKFLKNNPIPCVRAPNGRLYLIDHHHLLMALYKCGVPRCYVGECNKQWDTALTSCIALF